MHLANKNFTIADIAESAGVSKTTVSRYINGKYEYMSEKTRKRIEAIINVSEYRPNNIARSLKTQKSMLIGVVIADIESPFSSSLVKGVGDTLRTHGYNMIIVNSDNSYEKEMEYIRSLISQCVDGLIVNTTKTVNPFLIEIANRGMPVVLSDRFVKDYNFDIVYIENDISTEKAVHHLYENGYKTVGYFTQDHYEDISPRYLRRDAFARTLTSLDVKEPERYVFSINLDNPDSVENAIKRLRHLSGNEPAAIFTSNGVTLLHCLNAIKALDLDIPMDIGICGYDDWGWNSHMNWTSMVTPGITSVVAPTHEIGALTAQVLLNRIENPDSPKRIVSLPTRLEIRNSTILNHRI
jgi:Transcriptional regulators